MALTGLFLCLFLVGHLLGNLQLFKEGEEGRRAFNEYAYFMAHNIFIKVMSWLTYISIIFHAVDGIMLAVQNRKARPQQYAYNNPGANSSWASRNMALLGTVILFFIVTHMQNFWWYAKMSSSYDFPLHATYVVNDEPQQNPMTGQMVKQSIQIKQVLTTTGQYVPYSAKDLLQNKEIDMVQQQYTDKEAPIYDVKHKTELYDKQTGLKVAEGYKDLHGLVYAFFGHDKSTYGFKANQYALIAVIGYVLAMCVLAFHLNHGFASGFQSLGARHPRYTATIKLIGQAFSILIPLAFAIIPVYIYLTK